MSDVYLTAIRLRSVCRELNQCLAAAALLTWKSILLFCLVCAWKCCKFQRTGPGSDPGPGPRFGFGSGFDLDGVLPLDALFKPVSCFQSWFFSYKS